MDTDMQHTQMSRLLKCLRHGSSQWERVWCDDGNDLEFDDGTEFYYGDGVKMWCWDLELDVNDLIEASRMWNVYVRRDKVDRDMDMFAFQIEATRVMCLGRAIVDGDHAIKARVLRMLVA